MGGIIASFSSSLEAFWCAHNVQEISDPRQITLQAKLDSLEDSVNKFLTLSEVMNKFKKDWEDIFSFGFVAQTPVQSLKGFSSPASLGLFCESVPPSASDLCFFIDKGHFLHFPAPSSSASLQGSSTGPMCDGHLLG